MTTTRDRCSSEHTAILRTTSMYSSTSSLSTSLHRNRSVESPSNSILYVGVSSSSDAYAIGHPLRGRLLYKERHRTGAGLTAPTVASRELARALFLRVVIARERSVFCPALRDEQLAVRALEAAVALGPAGDQLGFERLVAVRAAGDL